MTLAVGFFDGVHLGHQAILRGADAALTFTNHPLTVLAPDRAPPLIMSLDARLAAIRACGVRDVIALDFTPELANLSPEEFVEKLLSGRGEDEEPKSRRAEENHFFRVQALLSPKSAGSAGDNTLSLRCGANWRFGKGGAGDAAFLRARGIPVTVVPFAVSAGEPISSTRIRKALAAGDLAAASAMMGRPFTVRGVVRSGKGLGRTIGYPTQNFELEAIGIQLPLGVYVVERDGCRGVANYGRAPTLGPQAWPKPVLEVHWLRKGFFDFSINRFVDWVRDDKAIVNRKIEESLDTTTEESKNRKIEKSISIVLLRFLRPERKFDSLDSLKAQIACDCAEAMQ